MAMWSEYWIALFSLFNAIESRKARRIFAPGAIARRSARAAASLLKKGLQTHEPGSKHSLTRKARLRAR